MKLKDLGFRVMGVLGLGLSGLINQFTPIANGGAFFQGTTFADRSFTLLGALTASTVYELQMYRQALTDAFKPDRVSPQQPLLLRYTPVDDCGIQSGEILEIPCIFESDLSGNFDNLNQERVPLTFRLYLPVALREEGDTGAVLSYQATVTNANRIIRRSSGGVWSAVGSSGFNDSVRVIRELRDGRIAIGGSFTNAGGDPNADYLAVYDPATDTISAFNNTPLTHSGPPFVLDIFELPNGNLLIGGEFTNAGGDANADYIALVNISDGSFNALNATPITGPTVFTISQLSDGDYVMGGNFTNAGGDADADMLARIDAATFAFSALNTTPLNATVEKIIRLLSGNLLIAGFFTNAAGDANADYICELNSDNDFVAITSSPIVGTILFDLGIAKDGTVYIGGQFTSAQGSSDNANITSWNGVSFIPLSIGVNNVVFAIQVLKSNEVLIGGGFNQAGPLTLPDHIAGWNGSSFFFVDIDFPVTPNILEITETRNGDIYIGISSSGSATAGAVTVVTNSGTAQARPRLTLYGPGTVYQLKNYTTGAVIYFNLTLAESEIALLDFSDPLNVTFSSNFRPNLLGTILPGSNFDFFLQPGANSISLFIAGTTDGNTAAVISWRNAHHGIDGARASRLLP